MSDTEIPVATLPRKSGKTAIAAKAALPRPAVPKLGVVYTVDKSVSTKISDGVSQTETPIDSRLMNIVQSIDELKAKTQDLSISSIETKQKCEPILTKIKANEKQKRAISKENKELREQIKITKRKDKDAFKSLLKDVDRLKKSLNNAKTNFLDDDTDEEKSEDEVKLPRIASGKKKAVPRKGARSFSISDTDSDDDSY